VSGGVALALGATAMFGAITLVARELLAAPAGSPEEETSHVLARTASEIQRTLVERGWQTSLERLLEGAGLAIAPEQLCLRIAGAAVLALLLGGLVGGPGLALCLLVATPLAAAAWCRARRDRRRRAFSEQIIQVLPTLTASLRAGHSFIQAVELAADELEDPAGAELRRVAAEIHLGRDQIEALRAMSDRYECDDLRWMVSAVEIHREVGGDLTLVLERVTETIRARDKLQREVRTLTAEGRASAKVLAALPLAAGLVMALLNRRMLAAFTGSPAGFGLLVLAGGLMVAGWVWLRIVTRVEV
jgi:tight adherence protein B